MEIRLLPIERLDELNAIYDMKALGSVQPAEKAQKIKRSGNYPVMLDLKYDFQQIREMNLRSGSEICAVAEENGVFVGEVSVMTENASVPAAVIPNVRNYLFGLRVLPAFQRQGIGTALLNFIISHLRQKGIREFTIAAEQSNTGARRLYERLGFKTLLTDCTEMQFGRQCRFDVLILK